MTAAEAGFVRTITQAAHTLLAGDIVRWNGTAWVVAQANSAANAGGDNNTGIVENANPGGAGNDFTLRTGGLFTKDAHGLTLDQEVYLSEATAGLMTSTKPSTTGNIVRKYGIAVSTSQIEMDIDNGITVE